MQTPGFLPPAPAPAAAKKTPAPGKKLRLRQKTCENLNLIEFSHFKVETLSLSYGIFRLNIS